MSVLQQLDQCLAALDDLSTNLDINLKLFWHLGYFWIVFLYWHIFKIKFFFPFKSRIVKRISGSSSECWEDSIWAHCAGLVTLAQRPGDPCHAVTCCLSCVTLQSQCHESCLRFQWSQQFCLVTPPPVGKWKMDSGLGGRAEDIMWQHPSKRAPPCPGKMLVSHYHPPTDISGYL